MTMMRRTVQAALTLACVLGVISSTRADLMEYVKKPEPKYEWKLKGKSAHLMGTVYDLHLVSQTWQDITWEHQLQVYQPKDVKPNGTLLIYNTGGGSNALNVLLGMELAKRCKTPVAFLYHIPNQPLLDGKKEDALIAETFVRYLKTKDENWPLLFPMVKSVVKSMDALEAFTKEEWKEPTKSFIISGGSKRGWTTWLTAVVDPRVKAIAPLVIDTLNMSAQLPHQIKSFGGPSEMIKDYTDRGLAPIPDTAEGKKLWTMVDPWAYREKLILPKLLVMGNNDPYWTTDAMNLYWDDLKGDKWVLYIPNAGHDLRQKDKDGKTDVSRVVNTLGVFGYLQSQGKSLPKLDWKHETVGDQLQINVKASPEPKAARLWVATAPTRDFRKAEWKEGAATIKDGTVMGKTGTPKEGCQAFFAELEYELDGLPYYLSTQIRITGTPVEKK